MARLAQAKSDALVEREHPGRVVDQDQLYDFFAHATCPHSRNNPCQDVVESVPAVGLQSVLGTDVVGQQDFALLAFGNHVLDHLDPLVIGRHVRSRGKRVER